MKYYHSLLLLFCCASIVSTQAGPRNPFEGRYEGKWGQPRGLNVRYVDNNEILEGGVLKAAIMLRIPAVSARRNGNIWARDVAPVVPDDAPDRVRLLTDFAAPDIRRGGRKAIYDAEADWKLSKVAPADDIPGTLRLKIIKRGSTYRIKRGNLQLFLQNGQPRLTKLTGQIRAKKK